ncbi:unnamed protein product [Prorocentrum cordatum]|uniref:Uncharacterized protein n=1 Tax=Prorocentrum cordatum TaxID=2364126 RepID=A0ABN9SD55_9DINO|nr:unnamed protein product [Polarella glacialis]
MLGAGAGCAARAASMRVLPSGSFLPACVSWAPEAYIPNDPRPTVGPGTPLATPGSLLGRQSDRPGVRRRAEVSPHQVPMACENRATRRSTLLSDQAAIRAQQDAALLVQQRRSVRQS